MKSQRAHFVAKSARARRAAAAAVRAGLAALLIAASPAAATEAPLPQPSDCPGLAEPNCTSDRSCFWVVVYGTAPGAPTAGFCTRRLSDAEMAKLSPPRLPSSTDAGVVPPARPAQP